MKIELSVHAFNLKNPTSFGTSDPYAVVTRDVSSTQAGTKPDVIGTTETIASTLSTNWASVFVIDIELGKPLIVTVQVQVYDQVKKERGGARGNTKVLTGTHALAVDEEALTKEQPMTQNVLQLCVQLREDESLELLLMPSQNSGAPVHQKQKLYRS